MKKRPKCHAQKLQVLLFPSKYLGVDVGADTILCKDLFEETTTGCMRNSLPHMIRAGLDADIDFEVRPDASMNNTMHYE